MTQLHIGMGSVQLPLQERDFPLQFSLNFRMFMYFSGNHRVPGTVKPNRPFTFIRLHYVIELSE